MDDVRKRINLKLHEKIEKYDSVYFKLLEAMKYSLLSGGKRIRPLIIYHTGVELGVPEDVLINLGTAVEMMHTASLIHDDLPAIDDDDFRRGKPSCHRVFGEGMALIAGDGLMLLALEVLNELEVEESIRLRLERKLLKSAGVCGMIGGEAEDIDMTGKDLNVDVERILRMYEKKTGALFGFSFSAPATCIEDVELEMEMEDVGRNFGVSFQIFDDLKDLTGSFEEIGKTPMKDEIMRKPTVPRVVGIDEAKRMADEIYRESMERLKRMGKFGGLVKLLENLRWEIERR